MIYSRTMSGMRLAGQYIYATKTRCASSGAPVVLFESPWARRLARVLNVGAVCQGTACVLFGALLVSPYGDRAVRKPSFLRSDADEENREKGGETPSDSVRIPLIYRVMLGGFLAATGVSLLLGVRFYTRRLVTAVRSSDVSVMKGVVRPDSRVEFYTPSFPLARDVRYALPARRVTPMVDVSEDTVGSDSLVPVKLHGGSTVLMNLKSGSVPQGSRLLVDVLHGYQLDEEFAQEMAEARR